ncbi:MAG: LysR family transcriptional regulator [Rhodospirillales bacterium]|jgi:DNA-binding transcriptional LysR family regulator
MTIELRYLRHFTAAVEQGGIGKAARSLNITQPGLTRSIRLLEEHLKVSLFERGSRGVTPTSYGLNFYSHAKSILSETERAEVEISEMLGDSDSAVTIGALPSQANFILPEATVRFLDANEGARVKVIQKARDEILPALLAGEFDFIFSILSDSIGGPDLADRLLFYDRPALIVRKDHPVLMTNNEISKELLKYLWVLPRPEADQRQYVRKYYTDVGLGLPNIAVECQSTPYLKSLVMQSDFIGILPTNFISAEERAGYLAPIQLPTMEFTIPFGFKYRNDRPVSAAAQNFMRQIEVTCGTLKDTMGHRLDFRI